MRSRRPRTANTGGTSARMAGILIIAVLAGTSAPAAAQNAGQDAGAAQGPATQELDELVRSRIEAGAGAVGPVIVVAGERVHARTQLPRFYERRGFSPAWVDEAGPRAVAEQLIAALEGVDREGLDPEDYHLRRIRALHDGSTEGGSGGAATVMQLADLELLLTDAFLLLASHLLEGRVDPASVHPEWNATVSEADLVTILESALAAGAVGPALDQLLPDHPGYQRLRTALARYREIAVNGGFPAVPDKALRPGMTDPAVAMLRDRLRLSGDLPDEQVSTDPERYDPALELAVRRLQQRHGMEPTGVAGLEVNTLLNTPVEERIRQIELNMERWRWLPRDLGQRYVMVNIAGYEVELVDGDSTVFSSRVMVGQRYRMTPVFSDRISYLVLNPTWTIPPGILETDKLPLIRRDPSYLARNQIRVLAPDGREVDPAGIDWSTITGRTSYRFRMNPGPENPLGRVKFMFPNRYSVYLHDTPDRDLFDRTDRAFSSGCIRVERPLELAEHLLAGSGWDRARIDRALERPGEQTIPLPQPVPVHLLYWTAWTEDDGRVHFRRDIYNRDAALDAALELPPPEPQAGPVGATGAAEAAATA